MARKIMTLIFFLVFCNIINLNGLELKQVLVLSRHNVRTPLISNLEKFSRKQWPKWDVKEADLTTKGALLENNMGKYFSEWMSKEKLFEGCPDENEVNIYANTKARTVNSAKAFTESAFSNCNITVRHKNTTAMDPIFNPIFHNNIESFLNDVNKEMKMKLDSKDLNNAYAELNRILDIKYSEICKEKSTCDLTLVPNKIVNDEDEEPNISGPLFYGNAIVDSFIMSFYNGYPMEEVAWGEIKTHDQWELLTKITKQNQNVRFNLTTGSKDLAKPLLHYMFKIFKNNKPRFTLLMGHDSNLNPVINALGFKPYELVDQFEPFPIGSKLVFQKWTDSAKSYLKIEYVYQNFLSLRNGEQLSISHPPRKVLMELNNCNTDKNGFCSWDDFMKYFTKF